MTDQKRPLVLLDVDGVLADFVGGVLEIVEDVTGLARDREEIDRFDFCDALGVGVDDARVIKRAMASRGFCDCLAPCEGARDGVRALQEIAEVRVITTPWDSSETWTYERESWLWRHFKIPAKHVMHVREKFRVPADAFVDDKTSAVREWRDAWPDRFAIRWNTPNNARDQWDGIRCSDWKWLASMIDVDANEREFYASAATPVQSPKAKRLAEERREVFGDHKES